MNNNFYEEFCELQKEYRKLIAERKLTKKAICDLCVPFRDKYRLNDLQTLRIAIKEMKLSDIVDLVKEMTNVEENQRKEDEGK